MRKFLLWFLAALLMTACGGCSATDDKVDGDKVTDADSLVVGDQLPAFEVTMNDGSVVRTADLKGQPSVVVLFSVDCPDCRHELPEVQKLWDRSRQGELTGDGKPLPIVLIARKNTVEDIEPFWKFAELTMPYSPQPDRKVYSRFAPSRIPRIYISDAAGIIRSAYADTLMPTAETLVEDISRVTTEKK
jgi:cytochrome oxidase Cu insertion factor (SCO1/SenC/PrrC family)